MEALWEAGARVRAYDERPMTMPECLRIYGERSDLKLCKSSPEVLEGADALAIVLELARVSQPGFRRHQKRAAHAGDIRRAQYLRPGPHGAPASFSYYAISRG